MRKSSGKTNGSSSFSLLRIRCKICESIARCVVDLYIHFVIVTLLPTGREERGVLGLGSNSVAILPLVNI